MHLFSGSALFSLKKRTLMCFCSCLRSSYSNFCWAYCETLFVLWLEWVRQTTAGIHNVIFKLLLGNFARNYDVTPRDSK